MAKLSKAQQFVVEKMRDGWELGSSASTMSGRSWLQKGGVGKGGEVVNVRWSTVRSLVKAGLIHQRYGFPTSTYTLAKATGGAL